MTEKEQIKKNKAVELAGQKEEIFDLMKWNIKLLRNELIKKFEKQDIITDKSEYSISQNTEGNYYLLFLKNPSIYYTLDNKGFLRVWEYSDMTLFKTLSNDPSFNNFYSLLKHELMPKDVKKEEKTEETHNKITFRTFTPKQEVIDEPLPFNEPVKEIYVESDKKNIKVTEDKDGSLLEVDNDEIEI